MVTVPSPESEELKRTSAIVATTATTAITAIIPITSSIIENPLEPIQKTLKSRKITASAYILLYLIMGGWKSWVSSQIWQKTVSIKVFKSLQGQLIVEIIHFLAV